MVLGFPFRIFFYPIKTFFHPVLTTYGFEKMAIKHNKVVKMSHAMRKPFLPYANNKGADQPAHPPQSDQRLYYSLLR